MMMFAEKIFWRIKKDDSGASLIIATVYVMFFMLAMTGLYEARIKTIQAIGNREFGDKARLMADSALEAAEYLAASNDVQTDDVKRRMTDFLVESALDMGITNCADTDPAADNAQPCVGFEAKSRPAQADMLSFDSVSWYSAPIKNTGNAGKACGAGDADANNSCNWNRLEVGKDVEIPLYYETKDAAGNVSVVKASADSFKLRVRTPLCGEFANASVFRGCGMGLAEDRVTLFPETNNPVTDWAYRDVDFDPVLIQWMIIDNANGNAMVARDIVDDQEKSKRNRFPVENTEISGGRINKNSSNAVDKYVMLDGTHKGIDLSSKLSPTIKTYILNSAAKPSLRLSLVTRPKVQPRNEMVRADNYDDFVNNKLLDKKIYDVPYLEYQLLLLGQEPPMDSKTAVFGWSRINDFGWKSQKYISRPVNPVGFALGNL